ncbi:MAG: hypothetical protein SGBAC_002127 [Bacillariaceae sp.]
MADEAKEDAPVEHDEEIGEVSADVEAQAPAAEGEETAEEEKVLTPVTIGVLGACGAMAGLYLAAMGIWGGGVLVLAGLVAIIVGGLVAKFQYFDLESLETLRTVHNRLRASVNDFSAENVKLAGNNDRLEEEIAPLKECEGKLAELAEKNGTDVNKLTTLVSENRKTLDKMHEIQKADLVQSLMQILMEVDRDEDGTLTDKEVKRLKRQLKNLPIIQFDEDKFDRRLGEHRQVSTLISMVHAANDETLESIIKVNDGAAPEDSMEEKF